MDMEDSLEHDEKISDFDEGWKANAWHVVDFCSEASIYIQVWNPNIYLDGKKMAWLSSIDWKSTSVTSISEMLTLGWTLSESEISDSGPYFSNLFWLLCADYQSCGTLLEGHIPILNLIALSAAAREASEVLASQY